MAGSSAQREQQVCVGSGLCSPRLAPSPSALPHQGWLSEGLRVAVMVGSSRRLKKRSEGRGWETLGGHAAKMAPEDVRWEGEEPDLNLLYRGAPIHGVKKSTSRGGPMLGAGRGRGPQKNSFKKDYPPSQNGVGKKSSDYIEILHTETLIKEVERVFSAGNPDPLEMERSKKVLKEHEQSLIDAIARLAEASNGEADDHAQSLEYNRGWRNQHGGRYGDDMAINGLMSGDADAM